LHSQDQESRSQQQPGTGLWYTAHQLKLGMNQRWRHTGFILNTKKHNAIPIA
jgi:hypothetical protein